ncbi:MAG: transglycosylase SLT domain-containing protein [Oscillospiraceae bacterium]|nr:transglycosylase SLT domain-containing protein [Oscillospiraceae bacterium]
MKKITGIILAAIIAISTYPAFAATIPDHQGTSMEDVEIGTEKLNSAVRSYSYLFKKAGDQYGVDPNLLAAICMQESSGRNLSLREDGTEYPAWGIMQIEYSMVETFAAFGKRTTGKKWTREDRLDEEKAIPFAAYLISKALIRYDCDYMKMIQSYNFGQVILDRIIEEKADDWLDERENAVEYTDPEWPYKTYGDPLYIEHVLRYYHNDIEYSGAKVRMNGELIDFDDQYPLLETRSGKTYTLIPIRGVSEALNSNVKWDGKNQKVEIKKGRHTMTLYVDSDVAYFDGEECYLDMPAMIKNNRTMVPLRFIMESFDLDVDWDGETRTVEILK